MNQLIDWVARQTGHDWIVLVFIVIFATLLLNYFVHKLYARLEQRFAKTRNL